MYAIRSYYEIATLSLLLPLATLGDFIGYRRVYLSGVIIFTLASLGCAFSPSLSWLIATRVLQGVGAAGIMSVNAALVRLIYPKEQLGKGIAINSIRITSYNVCYTKLLRCDRMAAAMDGPATDDAATTIELIAIPFPNCSFG